MPPIVVRRARGGEPAASRSRLSSRDASNGPGGSREASESAAERRACLASRAVLACWLAAARVDSSPSGSANSFASSMSTERHTNSCSRRDTVLHDAHVVSAAVLPNSVPPMNSLGWNSGIRLMSDPSSSSSSNVTAGRPSSVSAAVVWADGSIDSESTRGLVCGLLRELGPAPLLAAAGARWL